MILEQRLKKIEESQNAETELLTLFSLAHLEEKRWWDLRQTDSDSNTLTASVFHYAQRKTKFGDQFLTKFGDEFVTKYLGKLYEKTTLYYSSCFTLLKQ